jgi:DNA-directed RNA polymerase alpha subunit
VIELQIEDLYITVRALNSIRKVGITTTDELFSLDEKQMRLLKFGNKTINEILNYERTDRRINTAV